MRGPWRVLAAVTLMAALLFVPGDAWITAQASQQQDSGTRTPPRVLGRWLRPPFRKRQVSPPISASCSAVPTGNQTHSNQRPMAAPACST